MVPLHEAEAALAKARAERNDLHEAVHLWEDVLKDEASRFHGIMTAPYPARPDAIHALGRVAYDIATEKPKRRRSK